MFLHEFFDMTGAQWIRHVPAAPSKMTSGGKWAPLKLIAIVALPHEVPLVIEGDHTANGLTGKFATEPSDVLVYRALIHVRYNKAFSPLCRFYAARSGAQACWRSGEESAWWTA